MNQERFNTPPEGHRVKDNNYEAYLFLLQQRNRLLKKLKEKDAKQLDLERREQGFSLYLNGANVDLQLSSPCRVRKTQTAGGEPVERGTWKSSYEKIDSRARTAPSKPLRKGWNDEPIENIKIKTESGEKLTVGLPGNVSGKYSEDFELYQSYLEEQLAKEGNEGERKDDNDDGHNGDEDDNEDFLNRRQEDDEDSESEEEIAKLTFTVQDAKALRASLEMDSTIRKSIASIRKELESSDCEDETEDIKNKTGSELEDIVEDIDAYDALNESNDSLDENNVSEELISGNDKPTIMITSNTSSGQIRNISSSFESKELSACHLTGAAPKSRPVSAGTRRREIDNRISLINSSQKVKAAIEEENRKISEYQGKREIFSAPISERSAKLYDSIEVKDSKPRTIYSSLLTEEDISSITEKVRRMNGRQQRKLLTLLSEIEAIDDSFNESCNFQNEKKIIPEEGKNNRDTAEDKKTQVEGSKKTDAIEERSVFDKEDLPNKMWATQTFENLRKSYHDSDLNVKSLSQNENKLEIIFEFKNNWGNESYIGLTEIQIYSKDNKQLTVNTKDITILSENESNESIKNIVNDKTKTIKEKYMWKCLYNPLCSLELMLVLSNIKLEQLKEVIIWNYNKSLQELNIGVKDCRIFIGGEIVWQGIIDKGCGNQIFDYSRVIPLNKDDDKSDDEDKKKDIEDDVKVSEDRSITRTLHHKADTRKISPTIESPKKRLEIIRKKEDEICQASKGMNVKEYQSDDGVTKDIPKKSATSSAGKPLWLEDKAKVKKEKSSLSSLDIINEDVRPRSRPASGRRSQLNKSVDEMEKTKSPSSGRRIKLQDSIEDIDDFFDLNSRPKKSMGSHGRSREDSSTSSSNAENVPLPTSSPPILVSRPLSKESPNIPTKSERQKFKELMDVNLEHSFQSIDKFKFHHLGRITSNIDDDEVFSSYLDPIKDEDKKILESKTIKLNEERNEEVETVADDNESLGTFELPILPKGKELLVNIKTTWGDRHYVGLNGIEIFSKEGNLVKIEHIQANPANINVLPEYDGDPRVVENLIDGCYLTRDDMHLWLAPFTAGNDHLIEIQFEKDVNIAMIRIWNYNKSRIHSTRGARFVEIALDGKLIFLGEIDRASGVLSSEDPYGDMILYTMDDDILELVASNDFTYEVEENDEEDQLASSYDFSERPKTANNEDQEDSQSRPFTCPKERTKEISITDNQQSQDIVENVPTINLRESIHYPEDGFMQYSMMSIYFLSTWGDQFYLGLTGLEILGETFEKIPLTMDMLEATPRDLNDLDEYEDDDRTLDKLINDVNVTMSDENMWLIPYNEEDTHLLKIKFNKPTVITGIRIWNYNKSVEDTFRGVKTISIYVDDHEVSPEDGFLVRKGPGHCHFDFAQDILFNVPDDMNYAVTESSSRNRKINLQKIVNEYETLMMPSGFVFQLRLNTSWGDPYYIGLNGLEVYDQYGQKIELTDNNITAFPHSVNILSGVTDDVRTPDKLIDDVNDTYDGRHMWISPILPNQLNIVYIVFDEPVTISMIKLWNYSKTPTRGVRQFGLLVDDLLVYSGVLPQCALYSRAIIPGLQLPVTHHTILFTDAEEAVIKEKKYLLSSSVASQEQNVQLTNDRSVVHTYRDKNEVKGVADPEMRPITAVKLVGKPRR